MTENEFFNILMDELKELPELEIQKIILYYKRMLSSKSSSGTNEENIIESFGDPYLICIKYKNSLHDLKTIDNTNNISSNINIGKLSTDTKYTELSNDKKYHHDYSDKINEDVKTSPIVNKILKFFILILSLIIFFPILTSILGILIAIVSIPLSILLGSTGILMGEIFSLFIEIPHLSQLITDFPNKVIVLFALGSITLSIFMLCFLYYLCKLFFRLCIKIFKLLKSEGGFF